jgi:hypothetical protein
MTLAEHNSSIGSRDDFVAFVEAMSKDLRENPAAWHWKTAADMLMAARTYE